LNLVLDGAGNVFCGGARLSAAVHGRIGRAEAAAVWSPPVTGDGSGGDHAAAGPLHGDHAFLFGSAAAAAEFESAVLSHGATPAALVALPAAPPAGPEPAPPKASAATRRYALAADDVPDLSEALTRSITGALLSDTRFAALAAGLRVQLRRGLDDAGLADGAALGRLVDRQAAAAPRDAHEYRRGTPLPAVAHAGTSPGRPEEGRGPLAEEESRDTPATVEDIATQHSQSPRGIKRKSGARGSTPPPPSPSPPPPPPPPPPAAPTNVHVEAAQAKAADEGFHTSGHRWLGYTLQRPVVAAKNVDVLVVVCAFLDADESDYVNEKTGEPEGLFRVVQLDGDFAGDVEDLATYELQEAIDSATYELQAAIESRWL